MFRMDGKIALITGGASGIGLATAERLSRAGARVVIGDLQDAGSLAAELGGEFMKLDATDGAGFHSVIRDVVEHNGKLDVLVNCVGGGTPLEVLDRIGETEMLFDYRLNCLSTFHGMQGAARAMQDGGSIVNVASVAGLRGTWSLGAYNAAKAAVVNLTRTAALEYGPRGIRVNCVCPGVIETPMSTEESVQDIVEFSRRASPLGRNGRPEEVAAAIHFLCSGDCGFITGQAVVVDGGNHAGLSGNLLDACLGRVG